MSCPRCGGQVLRRLYDFDSGCLACGWVYVPPTELAKAEDDARRYFPLGIQEPRTSGMPKENKLLALERKRRASDLDRRARGQRKRGDRQRAA